MKKLISFGLMLVIIVFTGCQSEIIYRSTFTVTFHANGGYGEMDDQTFVQDKQQALSKNAFTSPQSGRTFGGWATKAAGEKVYSDAQYIKVTQNMNLYAVWVMAEGDGTATETEVWGIDETNNFWKYMDTSVKPGDDFYKYSIGGWQANPSSVGLWNKVEGRKDRTDDAGSPLYNSQLFCKDEISKTFKESDKEIFAKTKSLFIDPTTQEKDSEMTALLNSEISKINALSTQDEVLLEFVRAMLYYEPLYSLELYVSEREPHLEVSFSSKYIPLINLIKKAKSSNDFTLSDFFAVDLDGDSESIKDVKYWKRINCKTILGISDSEDATADINNKNDIYNFIKTLLESTDLEPSNTDAFINAAKSFGITQEKALNSIDEEYIAKLNLIGDPEHCEDNSYPLSIEKTKTFLKFAYASAVYDMYDNSVITYYRDNKGKLIPQWKDILLSMPFREPLLKAFYEKYMQNNNKNHYMGSVVYEMYVNLCATFIKRIENNSWMSDSAKKAAIKKIENIILTEGALIFHDPSLYDSLPENISSQPSWGAFYQFLYIRAFSYYYSYLFVLNDIPTDVKLFFSYMYNNLPISVDCQYHANNNHIIIPLPLLIDPVCNTDYADAYNYGILGSWIANSLCSALGLYGSQYDENGIKKDWWTLSDKLRYTEKQNQLIQMYNLLQLDSGTNGDGEKSLESNMSDLGGLSIAYDLFINKKIKEGFAGEELLKQKKMFFQSYAIAWASNRTDDDYEENMKYYSFSPEPFRVNGVVCQFDDWYDIYNVQKGDKYYLDPSQRIVLW